MQKLIWKLSREIPAARNEGKKLFSQRVHLRDKVGLEQELTPNSSRMCRDPTEVLRAGGTILTRMMKPRNRDLCKAELHRELPCHQNQRYKYQLLAWERS